MEESRIDETPDHPLGLILALAVLVLGLVVAFSLG